MTVLEVGVTAVAVVLEVVLLLVLLVVVVVRALVCAGALIDTLVGVSTVGIRVDMGIIVFNVEVD